jgi:hypothetical protein
MNNEKQVLRYARVPRASLRMTMLCFPLIKKKEASAVVILSAEGAKDLLLWEPS